MNKAETATIVGKLIRESKLLSDTFIGLEQIGKADAGQTMIKMTSGHEVLIHRKEDTLALLEDQRNDLIDSIGSALNKLDSRPTAV